jgi:hypothetical protein
LGVTTEEHEKIGVKYGFLRSRRENNWYPHCITSLDNLIPFGGSFPPIHMHADSRKIRLLRRTKAGPSGKSNYDHRIALTVGFS